VKTERPFSKSCLFLFVSVPKGPGLYQWFENQALSEAVSSVNVDPVDPHSASIQEILEASRLSKNKDLLQLLGKESALILTWLKLKQLFKLIIIDLTLIKFKRTFISCKWFLFAEFIC